jgi:hypothetical protein
MNILNEIKTLLGMEVKLEQMKLKDGTILEAETLEVGQPIFIVNGEEKVALPIGDYELENGQVLSIVEEGIIAEIKESEKAPEEKEVAMEDKVDYVTRAEFDELKAKIEQLTKQPEPVALSELPETIVEPELEAQPFVHSPENPTEKKEGFKFASSRKQTTLDIVLNNLNK